MLLSNSSIQKTNHYINCITHEGKVVLFGTAPDGKIYYTVKRDGYEDNPDYDNNGWENWSQLEFPNEDPDSSVVEKERKELTRQDFPNSFILQSRYRTNEESAVAPVQLVSGLGHIYVFRQSKTNTLLVDRFVLDGMTNTLNRKLEVRYQQSRKKYEPFKANKNSQGIGISSFDSLNFQDKDKKKFYEPTTEISIVNNLFNGWFSVVLLPTNELDKYRWHIFAYNRDTKKVEIISILASEEGLFDVKDSTVFDPKPGEPSVLLPRRIPGIIRRSLELNDDKGKILKIVNGLSATKYDVQSEILTQDNQTQLIKDATKIMLVIPTDQGNTVALSFAAAKDGTLSQISEDENSQILRSNNRYVLLPLNTLDEIKAIGDSTPPATGTIAGMARTEGDRIQITSAQAVTLNPGDNVKIQGTTHYNGYHVVQKINDNTFEIEAKWVDGNSENWQVGTWEELPSEQSGLVFDGIITAFERTVEGKLMITSPNHGLDSGDGVQISGTQGYDDTYPVTEVDSNRFTLDVKWQPGAAANVKLESRKQRGINFDGIGDYIEIPALSELKPPSPDYSFGETYSVWIYLSNNGTGEQLIVGEKGQLMQLALNNNQAILRVSFSDGFRQIEDPLPVTTNQWVHYAGIFSCEQKTTDDQKTTETNLILCRNGEQVAKQVVSATPESKPQAQDSGGSSNANKNKWQPEFLIGGTAKSNYFTGKISDVQVWNHARQPKEVQDSMYLRLTGKEVGLVGYWRLGAIVEGDKREVVDFSVFDNNGIVYGDAFVSAVTLARKLKDNKTLIVQYTNDEMFAVTQRATYIESFEFKLDQLIDPNNIDGKGNKVFKLSYWGKANRDSEKQENFLPENSILEDLKNGWYQASARFTIPDGVKMVRSFGLVDVKGDNWTKLEIRKHRIQLVSDAITEAQYSDEVKLQTLVNQQSAAQQNLQILARYEQEEGILLLRKWELEQANKPDRKINLEKKISELKREVEQCQKSYDDAKANIQNYWYKIVAKHSGKVLDVDGAKKEDANVHQWTWVNGDNQKWQFVSVEGGYYEIVAKHSGKVLDVSAAKKDNNRNVQVCNRFNVDNQKWKLEGLGGNCYKVIAKHSGKVLDVSGKSTSDGGNVQQYEWQAKDPQGQEWLIDKLDEYPNDAIKKANEALQSKNSELLKAQIELSDFNDASDLLNIVNQRLTIIQNEIKKLNLKEIGGQSKPMIMTVLATDRRKLITQGALLDFVRPTSRLTALETCEGNVQLTYFDNQGKMRQTIFDATTDSRNASFEQWIPDQLPLCLKLSGSGSINCGKIALDNRSFTIEFWAKRDQLGKSFLLSQGKEEKNKALHIGFRENGKFTFAFYGNDLDTDKDYNDFEWHHWCCVYDIQTDAKNVKTTRTRAIYRDGEEVVKQNTENDHEEEVAKQNTKDYQGSGDLILGQYINSQYPFVGRLVEVRIWEIALSAEEVAVNSKVRLSGNEPGLVAYYPLNELDKIRDLTGKQADGNIQGTPSWIGCTAPIGKFKHSVLRLDGVDDYLKVPNSDELDFATNQNFTVESWIKADLIQQDKSNKDNDIIEKWEGNQGYPYVIRYLPDSGQILAGRYDGTKGVAITSAVSINDGQFHHVSFVKEGNKLFLYINGKIANGGSKTDTLTANTKNGSPLYLGCRGGNTKNFFTGQISELRIWNKARTEQEIQANMHKRLTGTESGLVGYWPLNEIDRTQVLDLKGTNPGTVEGPVITQDYTLPIGEDALISCEYSTIGLDADQKKSAMMRRFFAYPSIAGVNLLPDKRIETLEMAWIGNAQINPTLLGYIEGAPPIPSENLTIEDNYNAATSVELVSSEDVAYSWNREQEAGLGATSSLFMGVDQKVTVSAGVGAEVGETALETRVGFQGNLSSKYSFLNSSNVSSSSGLNITNKLSLVGTQEKQPKFNQLGSRFIPKNVGYAVVVSGLADVFILRLSRSQKVVGTQILPNENIPLDVNTITFLINPAYTMNGSLDGMTGSKATSERFFQQVSEKRAQYGSLYPASYFRLLEAYDLKKQIDYRDQQRKSYFEQFNSRLVDEASLDREVNNSNYNTGETNLGKEDETKKLDQEIKTLEKEIENLEAKVSLSPEDQKKLDQKGKELDQKQKQKEAALQDKIRDLEDLRSSTKENSAADDKKKEINSRFNDASQQIHATESLAGWQKKMENIQLLAGKRNIVNAYVWDADGGFYSESQQFSNSIEHTIGGSFNLETAVGGQGVLKVFGVGSELQAQATVHMTQTMTKTVSQSKGFALNVDISGVESRGITDYKDRPILPGEKVDRYRFMSFYLEGSTNNFNDFFAYVVDPEWLASNDEEARALRQTATGSPNKTWRILHRVTYVERPALMS
ncbi:LamG-like jellyroll fold domain-containing protein [Planktothrix paucivesiculata]|uniref:Uncharacterized protein n=1 Tax=Planktothrix paucivesiculata PCC 9631 TaxID=671071 RepID=A0A7Z9C0W8_9CYAN|nr:LamG-like jellyroll fold domain-containing protein [Planktothrix paucivesiculata]VXD25271.1 conserved hypothetical protein [Planktothrix paucivesiculata PCC 9631]